MRFLPFEFINFSKCYLMRLANIRIHPLNFHQRKKTRLPCREETAIFERTRRLQVAQLKSTQYLRNQNQLNDLLKSFLAKALWPSELTKERDSEKQKPMEKVHLNYVWKSMKTIQTITSKIGLAFIRRSFLNCAAAQENRINEFGTDQSKISINIQDSQLAAYHLVDFRCNPRAYINIYRYLDNLFFLYSNLFIQSFLYFLLKIITYWAQIKIAAIKNQKLAQRVSRFESVFNHLVECKRILNHLTQKEKDVSQVFTKIDFLMKYQLCSLIEGESSYQNQRQQLKLI